MFPDRHHGVDEDDEPTLVATAVLQHRLDGASHGNALSRVAVSHALSAIEVDEAWAARKREALTRMTIGRVVDACPWTDAEIDRLLQIYSGEPWFVSSLPFERSPS